MKVNEGFSMVILLLVVCLAGGCSARLETQPAAKQSSSASSSKVVEAEPAWFGCKTQQDCTVVEGLCGSPHAVNRSFLQQFYAYRDRMNTVIECATNPTRKTPPVVQCIQQRCSLAPEQE